MAWCEGTFFSLPTKEWIARGFWDWSLGLTHRETQHPLHPELLYSVSIPRSMFDSQVALLCETVMEQHDEMGIWTYDWCGPSLFASMVFHFSDPKVATFFRLLLDG